MTFRDLLIVAAMLLPALSTAAPWSGHRGSGHGKGHWNDNGKGVIPFTSKYSVVATPGQVVNGTTQTGGLPGAEGYYEFGINSKLDVICYYITLRGFRGDYVSPAITATHIHQAARGASGPPRLAFPNPLPVANSNERISVGCLQGPFRTGVIDNSTGQDTAAGFRVAAIESNPSDFFADVHSTLAVPGAVRGQLA